MKKEALFFILLVGYSSAGLLEDVARGIQGGVEGVKHHLEKNVQAVKDVIGNVIPKKRHSEEWHRHNPQYPNPYHNHGDDCDHHDHSDWQKYHNGGGQQWGGHKPEYQGNNFNGQPTQGQGNWNNGWNNPQNNYGRQPSQGDWNSYGQNQGFDGGRGGGFNPQGNWNNFRPTQGVDGDRDTNFNSQNNGQQFPSSGKGNKGNADGLVNNWNPKGNNGQETEDSLNNKPKVSTPPPAIPTTEETFSLDVRGGLAEEQNDEGRVQLDNRFLVRMPMNCGPGTGAVGTRCRPLY